MNLLTRLTQRQLVMCRVLFLAWLGIAVHTVNAQSVMPVRPTPSSAQALPTPIRPPNAIAPEAPAPAENTQTDNAKMGGSHTCWCEVECTSNQNGQTVKGGVKNPEGLSFAWPITPAKHDQCSSACLRQLQGTAQTVADQGQLCKDGICKGRSWIGTGIGGDRWTNSNVSFNNSNEQFCRPGPIGETLCCPGYIANSNLSGMFSDADHTPGNPFAVSFQPSGAMHTQFATAVQAQLNLAKLSGCSAAHAVRITYSHWNTNSTTAPTAWTPGSWAQQPGGFTVTYPISGSPTVSGIPNFAVPNNPNYFVVGVSAVTTVNAQGNPVACGEINAACFSKLRYRDINSAGNFRVAPGANSGAQGGSSRTEF